MSSFVDQLEASQKQVINRLRKIIQECDPAVTEQSGKIMSAKDALCYSQENVFKYGLAKTKTGYSFHSMVMYANSDIYEFTKSHLNNVKLQKGCVNIASLGTLDIEAFEELLRFSASKDFSPVIDHYQSRSR